MAPRRDPETGEFVSGPGPGGLMSFRDLEAVAARIDVNIPAADNTGDTSQDVSAVDVAREIVDFDDHLESDEVFVCHGLQWNCQLWLPTTATAEGTAVMEYLLGRDPGFDSELIPFLHQYNGSPDHSPGRLNISGRSDMDNDHMVKGVVAATSSFRDTVNTLGGGAQDGYDEHVISYPSMGFEGPNFDDSDSLGLMYRLSQQEVADHGISFLGNVVLYGFVDER